MRGSDQLAHEMRVEAVTYKLVTNLHYDFVPFQFTLECGHRDAETNRNPAYLGQVRFCTACTNAKRDAQGV